MTQSIQVLDNGFVSLVESYGSDERIIEAARMSTQKGFEGWGPRADCKFCGGAGKYFYDGMGADVDVDPCDKCRGDEKLLAYLWKNNHATPFEMGGAVFEIQAPIFVFREWQRHRTQSYNEASARYSPLPAVDYHPTVERLMMGGGQLTKQAAAVEGSTMLQEEVSASWLRGLHKIYELAEQHYQEGLSLGVPKELARVCLPVGRYSKMRASANLRNWLGFLTLRMAPQAQWEIRQYANAVHDLLLPLFPRTLALFDAGTP